MTTPALPSPPTASRRPGQVDRRTPRCPTERLEAYNAADEAQDQLTLDRVRALLPRFVDQQMPSAAEQLREALDGKGAGPARKFRRYIDGGGPATNARG